MNRTRGRSRLMPRCSTALRLGTSRLASVLLITIIAQLATAMCSYGSQDSASLAFTHITAKDGLSHSEVLFILQDSQGFMWFGTKHGLNKYDGSSITTFLRNPTSKTPDGPAGNFAHWMQEDQSSNMWIATWGDGISRYNPRSGTFNSYRHDEDNQESLGSDNVWSIFVDRKGSVWAATDGGLSKCNPATGTVVRYRHDPQNTNSLSHDTVSRIREDAQGILWISTYGGGLNRFNPLTERFTSYKHEEGNTKSLGNNNLWGVYIDSHERVWLASEAGLNRFDPKTETFTRYQRDESDPHSQRPDIVTFITEDRAGMLWMGTFGNGLVRFDPEQETFVRHQHDPDNPHSLGNNTIMSIEEDDAGALWVATYGGVDRYDPGENQFKHYHSKNSHQMGPNVRSIYDDRNGSLWIGTDDGLSCINRKSNSEIHYSHDPSDPTSISGNAVWAIDQDSLGNLWLGTHGSGVSRFNLEQGTFTRYPSGTDSLNATASDVIYDLTFDDSRNALWIAAYLSGLDKLNIADGTITHYRHDATNANTIVSPWITAVFLDSSGLVWVGTDAGLSQFDPETEQFTNFTQCNNRQGCLSDSMIQMIFEDSRKQIWVGTANGLNRYEPITSTFEAFFQRDGLPGNRISAIVEDNSDNLWVSTDKGLSRFDPLNKTFRNYDHRDGLQGTTFLIHSAHRNAAGELFFGSSSGLDIISPEELIDNPLIPNVVFTSFKLFNEPVTVGNDSPLRQHINLTQQITLTHAQSVLSIGFAALNYRNSSKNQYAYMLKGLDKDYILVDSDHRFTTYTSLDPGKYEFHVKASNNDGLWNEAGRSIAITILPAWWQTLWFRCALGLAATSLIFMLVNLRLRSIRQSHRQLESQLDLQAKELNTRKALSDSEKKYKLLFEQAGDYILLLELTTDNDLVIVDANEAACRIHGYTRDEFLGLTIRDIDRGLKADEVRNIVDTVMSGETALFETEHAKKDGTAFPIEVSASLLDSVDQRNLIVAVERDISERRDTANAIQLLVENSVGAGGQGFFDSIVTGLCDFAGAECAIIAEVKNGKAQANAMQLDGKLVRDYSYDLPDTPCDCSFTQGFCIYPEGVAEIFPGDKDLVDMGAEGYVGTALLNKDGKAIGILCVISRHKLNLPPGTQSVMRILAAKAASEIERKKAEQRETNLRERLADTERRESLGVLAGGVAHDLNNILGPMVLLPDMVTELLENPEEASKSDLADAREDMAAISRSAKRAADVVQNLKALGAQGPTTLQPMDLASFVEDCMSTNDIKALRRMRPRVKIASTIGHKNLAIAGDAIELHRVLLNLVINAVEAIPDRGQVEVEAEPVVLDKLTFGYETMEAGSYIGIHVRDTGEGISDELRRKVFDPFVTTKREAGGKSGSGLGLSVVHATMKAHGGHIDMTRNEEKWSTTISLYFPAIKDVVPQVAEDRTGSEVPKGSEHILVVDDEPGQRFIVRRCLQKLGYDVTEATNGHEAVALFKVDSKEGESRSPFDLVILDMTMEEGFDGLDTYNGLLELSPDQKVIIASGHAENTRIRSALDLGANWLAKPYDGRSLAEAVRESLKAKES